MVRNAVLSVGVCWAIGATAIAKPPGVPTAPETEFKVLSPLAQEFHQGDEATASTIHLAIGVWNGDFQASGAAVGAASRLAQEGRGLTQVSLNLTIQGDCSSFIKHVWNSRFAPAKERLAKEVFEMAETHRLAGDWTEAKRWYNGVRDMYPHSSFARQAAERLERYQLLRVLAEAGEEQSEEPPIADPHGPEVLKVAPREVK